MELEKLKEKIFEFGIFGRQLRELTEDEIKMAIQEPWIEIVTEKQIQDLKTSFTLLALESFRNEIYKNYTSNKNILLREKYGKLHVRMNTVAWKEYLTNGAFNFTSQEYFFVFDLLIKSGSFVCVGDMRATLNIEPKKMFYIIKKLVGLGYVQKEEGVGKCMVKIIRNSDGKVYKLIKKEKRSSINKNDHEETSSLIFLDEKKLGRGILYKMPLHEQLRRIVDESRTGISSRDIEQRLGIRIKLGLKLLNKLAEKYEGSIRVTEEFEGKIKRAKFYNVNELVKNKEKRKNGILNNEEYKSSISLDDRIEAIEQMLLSRESFILDKESYLELKNILGSKYMLDRRTIANAAIKGGFNVYKLKYEINSPAKYAIRYVIARKEIKEEDQQVQKFRKVPTSKKAESSFQKSIYKYFVCFYKFIEADNGYIVLKSERIRMLYKFILDFMNNKNLALIKFDREIIDEMDVSLILSLIPFQKKELKSSIIQFLERKENETLFESPSQIPTADDFVSSSFIEDESKIDLEEESYKKSHFLHIKVGEIRKFKEQNEFINLLLLKAQSRSFDSYFADFEKYKLMKISHVHSVAVIEKNKSNDSSEFENILTTIFADNDQFSIKDVYIPLNRRLYFYEGVKNFNESSFYEDCFAFIHQNFSAPEIVTLKNRLEVFKKAHKQIYQSFEKKTMDDDVPEKLQGLYMSIKKDIIENKKLVDLKFENYKLSDLEEVLNMLSQHKIVVNFKNLNSLHSIEKSDFLKKKLSCKISNVCIPTDYLNSSSLKESSYYKYFFDLVYYVLATNGSLNENLLIEKVGIMRNFELTRFLEVYKDVFEVKIYEYSKIISIRESNDFFPYIFN